MATLGRSILSGFGAKRISPCAATRKPPQNFARSSTIAVSSCPTRLARWLASNSAERSPWRVIKITPQAHIAIFSISGKRRIALSDPPPGQGRSRQTPANKLQPVGPAHPNGDSRDIRRLRFQSGRGASFDTTTVVPAISEDLSVDRVSAPERRRILVIDDEADIRESLELLLTGENYAVDLAENATIGLQKFESGSYDLVLLDLMMPDRSGMEVLADIRQRDQETPIFMLTAYGSVEVAVRALKSRRQRLLRQALG